jgi:hypothetical protein
VYLGTHRYCKLSRPLKAFLAMDEMVFPSSNLREREEKRRGENKGESGEPVSERKTDREEEDRKRWGENKRERERVKARYSELVTLTGFSDC